MMIVDSIPGVKKILIHGIAPESTESALAQKKIAAVTLKVRENPIEELHIVGSGGWEPHSIPAPFAKACLLTNRTVAKYESRGYWKQIAGEWYEFQPLWAFSPKWKFPAWMKLRGLKQNGQQLTFTEFCEAGHERTLWEYAGLIDLGHPLFDFGDGLEIDIITGKPKALNVIKPDSPLVENIRSFLEYRYGGPKGLSDIVELWLEAMDTKNSGVMTKHAWKKVPVELADINREIFDGVFMGSVTEDGIANTQMRAAVIEVRRTKPSLDAEGNEIFEQENVTLRRYSEGRILLRRGSGPKPDDDPSPFTTCGVVRSKGQLRYKANLIGDNKPSNARENMIIKPLDVQRSGIDENWEPTPEQFPAFLEQAYARGAEVVIKTVGNDPADDIPAGFARIRPSRRRVKQVVGKGRREHIGIVDEGPQFPIEVIPSKIWYGYFENGKRVPGYRESLPSDIRKAFWQIPKGQVVRVEDKIFFIKDTTRTDATQTTSEAKRNLEAVDTLREHAPDRLLSKVMVFDRNKEQWREPYSFENRNTGKVIHVRPKPGSFITSDWDIYRRHWNRLETIRQLLQEERWEYLAFDRDENRFDANGIDWSTKPLKEQKDEAYGRIYAELQESLVYIEQTTLDADVKEDFKLQIENLERKAWGLLIQDHSQNTISQYEVNLILLRIFDTDTDGSEIQEFIRSRMPELPSKTFKTEIRTCPKGPVEVQLLDSLRTHWLQLKEISKVPSKTKDARKYMNRLAEIADQYKEKIEIHAIPRVEQARKPETPEVRNDQFKSSMTKSAVQEAVAYAITQGYQEHENQGALELMKEQEWAIGLLRNRRIGLLRTHKKTGKLLWKGEGRILLNRMSGRKAKYALRRAYQIHNLRKQGLI